MLMPGDHEKIRSYTPVGVWFLRTTLAAGPIALAFAAIQIGPVVKGSPLLTFVLLATSTFVIAQVLPNWVIYAAARRPPRLQTRPAGLSVDVFVTACNEPAALVEHSLAAACRMSGEHSTFLLDDGKDPALEKLARRLGAHYLTRDNSRDAKAGNVNAALSATYGDVIAVFDVDHVPSRDFLDQTLEHFANQRVGFVQVMLTFNNGEQRWVAHAATETTIDFFNPTSLGMDALGGTSMMGSNSLIRRSALESIGGYRPGLAEDLATSVALHAAGWQSAYVAAPLAPGMAPEDIAAWFTQQMKWSRGVFEVFLSQFPRVLPQLSGGQLLTYLVRMTSYLIGPLVAVYLAATIRVLFADSLALADRYQIYLLTCAPATLVYLAARLIAINLWRHPSVPSKSLWRAVALVYFTWPIYTLSWLMAVFRVPLAFRPTPKSGQGDIRIVWLVPQIGGTLLLAGGIANFVAKTGGTVESARHYTVLLGFAIVQALAPLIVLVQRFHPDRLRGWRDELRTRDQNTTNESQ